MNLEPLYQALIPKGQLEVKFEIPKFVDDYINDIAKDPSSIHNLNLQQIQFIILTFKCCCMCNACKYGIPKNLSIQYEIFSFTFCTAFIDFLTKILDQNIAYLDRYCSKVQKILQTFSSREQNFEAENPDSKMFEGVISSFAHTKAHNLITKKYIENYSKEIQSTTQLPSITTLIDDLDQILGQIINSLKNAFSKPDQNVIASINSIIASINQKCDELKKCSDEFKAKLKGLFDPFSPKSYGTFFEFIDNWLSALNAFVFMAIKIVFFSDFQQAENNNFFTCLYKIASNSVNILTHVHKLAHYRTNYNLSVVSIKYNFVNISDSLPNIHKEILIFLKSSPTLFQEITNFKFTSYSKIIFDVTQAVFMNQMEDFFTRIKSAKKSIVFKPINEYLLSGKDDTICFFTNFQKCAYTIAFSLIKNNYQAYQLTGMTVLLQNSYTKLINHLSSQVVNKNLSMEERVSISLSFHSIQHAMSLFVNEFSEFGANPDDNFLRSKSSLVALNLVFEAYSCNSNIEMTDMMENSLKMFLVFIGEANSIISSFYLIYRRAIQISVYHTGNLFSIFTKLLLRQLLYGADGQIANMETTKKLNKVFNHKLAQIQKYAIFDRSFTFPNSLNDIVNELKKFVDSLVFCSENYGSVLIESIKNFNKFYTLVSNAFNRAYIGCCDYDIDFFNEFVQNTIAEVQKYRNTLSSSFQESDSNDAETANENDKCIKNHSFISNSIFILSKSLFEICCLARQIKNVPIYTIEDLRSNTIDVLEKSIELTILTTDEENGQEKILEDYNFIKPLLDSIENILSNEILSITSGLTNSKDNSESSEKTQFTPRDIFVFSSYENLWSSKKGSQGTPSSSAYTKKMKGFYQNFDKSLESFQKSPARRTHRNKKNLSFILNDDQDNENNPFVLTSNVNPSIPTETPPPKHIQIIPNQNISLMKQISSNASNRSKSIMIKGDSNDYLNQIGLSQSDQVIKKRENPRTKNKIRSFSNKNENESNENPNIIVSQFVANTPEKEDIRLRSEDKRISLRAITPLSSMVKALKLPEFNNWKIRNSIPNVEPPLIRNDNNTDEDNKSEESNLAISMFPSLKVLDSDSVLTLAGQNKASEFNDSTDSD